MSEGAGKMLDIAGLQEMADRAPFISFCKLKVKAA